MIVLKGRFIITNISYESVRQKKTPSESRPEIRFALTVRMPSKCAVAFVHVMKVMFLHLSSGKVTLQMLSLRKSSLTAGRLGLKKLKCFSIEETVLREEYRDRQYNYGAENYCE